MKSFDRPTSEQIEAAVPLLSSPQHEMYFFANLENPLWITPLQERGMFDHPPMVEHVKGGGIRFPIWAASKYLARMATHAPDEVAGILSSIETDNVIVIGDIVDAALAMPAKVAATLVPVIARSIQGGASWLHFKDASDLCVHLATGGEVSSALVLAKTLFAPRIEEGRDEPSQHDAYWYNEGLRKVVPALVPKEPRELLELLCKWLKVAIDAMKHVDTDSGSDDSYRWRPAIEEHEQNRQHDFAATVVGFVRQGFELAIRDGNLSLEEGLGIIARYSYLVFRRIKIHLINEFADENPRLARQIMLDRSLFDDYKYKHEYAMLVGCRLNVLTAEERDTWFGWIDAGPNMSGFNESIKRHHGRDATNDDRQERIRYWKFGKFHCVRKHLEGERGAFYEAMLAQHGEPELADLSFRIGSGRWGDESPMAVEDLAKLTFKQAVERVSSWKPKEREFMGPNREGLASTFGQYVATEAEAFSSGATALIGRPPIFVLMFIEQMAKAVKGGHDIDIHPVLELCRWVIERPMGERTALDWGVEGLVNEDWQSTRDEVSQFVRNICEAKTNDCPKYPLDRLRDKIWQALSVLCRDRAKSNIVHDVSKDDPRIHDYLTLGVNSSRGKALEAALEYARWIANHIKYTDGKNEVIPGGFAAMPEVREVLEWQIDPPNRSVEALAVIGSRVNLIYWIDKEWLASNSGRLFHLGSISGSPPMPHDWAAWNAFLVWNRPHIEFYRLFKKQFAYAVAQSTQVVPTVRSREEPMYRLGEHLMVLYGRGELGIDDDEGLLRRFLSDTNPDIRRHAVGFVGESLGGEEQIPEDIVRRFQALWELYWTGAGQRDAEEKPDSSLFGTWFSSGQFPDQWALEQLERFVGVSPTPEPDHSVAERLAKIAVVDIVRAVRILDRMVRGDREGWRIHMWLDSAGQILESAIQAGGGAQKRAVQIIDFLGRRGYSRFGELLNLKGVSDTL